MAPIVREEAVNATIVQREVDQPTVVIQEAYAASAPLTAERVVTETTTTSGTVYGEGHVQKKSFGQKMKEKLTGHP